MSAYIRLQSFITAAQLAYDAPHLQRLVIDSSGNQAVVSSVAERSLNARGFQEENRRTWTAFLESLNSALGSSKIYKMCKRYRFDPLKRQRQGLPLLAEHVEMFSIGASRVSTKDLKQHLHQTHLKDLSAEQLSEQLSIVNPFPVVGWAIDPSMISGDPTHLSGRFIFDPLLMDKETQLLLSDVEKLSFFSWQERFCKAVVNRELFEKQIIPAPGAHGRVEYYKIYRRIATGDGLVAYALVPLGSDSTLKPLLVFRPTQSSLASEDAIETYLNDIQPSIGKMGYLAGKSRLDHVMQDPKFCPPSERIEIAGYSLGGTHAQRFLADHWAKISEATFYNDPAVESELAEKFAQEINREGAALKPMRLNIFRTGGDLVHLVGEKHLGWGITNPQMIIELLEFNHKTKTLSLSELHGRRVLDNQYRDYDTTVLRSADELNTYLDNAQRGISVCLYEKARKCMGGMIYTLLSAFRGLLHFFSLMLGINILRSSKRYTELG